MNGVPMNTAGLSDLRKASPLPAAILKTQNYKAVTAVCTQVVQEYETQNLLTSRLHGRITRTTTQK